MKGIYKKVFLSILISFSIITIFQMLYSKNFNIFSVLKFPLNVLLINFFILFLVYFINALRLQMLLKFFGYKFPFKESFKNIFFGAFFTFITPMSIGGQPYQIYHLVKNNIKGTDATNIVISKTLEISFVILFLDLIFIKNVLKFMPKSFGLSIILIGFFVGLSISFAIFLSFVNRKILKKFLLFLIKIFKLNHTEEEVDNWIDNLQKSIKTLWLKNPWLLILDMFLYFITLLLYNSILFLIVKTFFGGEISFFSLLAILVMMNTVAYYVPTPGSSGGIEGTYQVVFSDLFGPANAINIITIYRFVTFYVPLILGTIFFTISSKKDKMKMVNGGDKFVNNKGH
ncbi:MAG: flippase-like domain-containing protein [Thermosipho sp. (in: Bacteria)]|nr:flippase-like domain-containing protein [Thermosipho sp. (in: thermotogales)]